MTNLAEILALERERLSLFCPVVLGIGIICGVFWPTRSPIELCLILVCLLAITLIIAKKSRIFAIALLIFSMGLYVSQTGGILNTTFLPQKKFLASDIDRVKFRATVEFIDETHPTMKGMRRITLRDMEFDKMPTLNFIKTGKMTCSERMTNNIQPNDIVEVTGKLSTYKTAAIPGSFDQLQYNALVKLDVTGIVYQAHKIGNRDGIHDVFSYMRRYLTRSISDRMEHPAGGVASALLTGDKSSITPEIRDKFINSGTAHILAISGLHMSIAASLIFLLIFRIMLYVSCVFHRISAKIYAAVATIPVTFLYLALSGFSPSATRAFIMTTIFMISVAIGRKAVSLRSISSAAFLIMLFDAGALFLVSFQLSFCAVVALISCYETFQQQFAYFRKKYSTWYGKICFYTISSTVTTLIATIATSPISIATFNRLSLSGILGNLVAIPAISFVVAPLGVMALLTCKITDVFVDCLGEALQYLILVVGYISEMPGSLITIKSPSIYALYLIVLGGIIWALLKTNVRHFGHMVILMGFSLWVFEECPDIIVPPNTNTVCFVEDGQFYATSLQKGRRLALSIQRNIGFDGKLLKKEISNFPFERKVYENGLYIWSRSNKVMYLARRRHPFCPAYFIKF